MTDLKCSSDLGKSRGAERDVLIKFNIKLSMNDQFSTVESPHENIFLLFYVFEIKKVHHKEKQDVLVKFGVP